MFLGAIWQREGQVDMNIDTGRVRDCLKRFDFRTLFVEELGWNIYNNRPIDHYLAKNDKDYFRLDTEIVALLNPNQ